MKTDRVCWHSADSHEEVEAGHQQHEQPKQGDWHRTLQVSSSVEHANIHVEQGERFGTVHGLVSCACVGVGCQLASCSRRHAVDFRWRSFQNPDQSTTKDEIPRMVCFPERFGRQSIRKVAECWSL